MQFNLIDLRELLLCLKDHNIQRLNIAQNDFELVINKETVTRYNSNLLPRTGINLSSKATQVNKSKNQEVTSNSKQYDNHNTESKVYFTIVSPMVGTFYRSPGPNEPYFIELHDKVNINQTVCIVEAMKLMNEIEAEVPGEVVEILVNDGDIVDCGQALMKIKSF
uniref:Biotin carboxyl carrier protein of acetyl-CoA carboxylase n=1 Tax=Trichogloeopsis pedicellata TaxID=1495610 RepID=A0A1G4P0M0_9FLOR|nr:Acetyl-CoA carboxylase, biotin carboxyl carrier protein [Trichogloeopsis pedicellata]SCW24438.1 Acetyl-CoA carboxylase, biotin carboxyl carrier protein [Trichogloeopsis pedicellata]